MKNNNFIAIQALMLLCAFALPFISLYCQDAPRRLTRIPKYEHRQRQNSAKQKNLTATRSIQTPIEPNQENKDNPPQEISTKTSQETEDSSTQEDTKSASDAKQTQTNSQTPRPGTSWYNRFAPLFLAALYKGSESGINAFSNVIIKLFVKRRDTLKDLEARKKVIIENLPIEENKELAIQEIDIQLEKLKQPVSLSSIASTGAYIGMLNTAIPMMGIVMGSTIKIALQMLMPVENY